MYHRKLGCDGVLKEGCLLFVFYLRLDLGVDEFVTLGKGYILQGVAGCYLGTGPAISQPQQGEGQECCHQPPVAIAMIVNVVQSVIYL